MLETVLTKLCQTGVDQGAFPGAAFGVVTTQGVLTGCVGRHTYCPESPSVTAETLWDLASVSKVLATTTLAMRAEVDLDAPVQSLLAGFVGQGKEAVTVRHLLTHRAGLPAFRPYHKTTKTAAEARKALLLEPLIDAPGKKSLYSDLSMILLGWILERQAGLPLDQLSHEKVFVPLGMTATCFNPKDRKRCAPTEVTEPWRNSREPLIQGVVHDPTAFRMDGVAGHAGVFSTLNDMIKFAKWLLAGGKDLVRTPVFEDYTRKQNPDSSRALGWDTRSEIGSSAGTRFSIRSFGHTGFTGTSLWIDPEAKVGAILLTNRVHPTADNPLLLAIRPKFHDSIVEGLR